MKNYWQRAVFILFYITVNSLNKKLGKIVKKAGKL